MARPIDFAPPFGARDAVGAPSDPPDERIDVGVAVVGGGPGGLACASRLGQLLEEHPDVRERLGDVPIAVLEKGKQAGSHLLSGAVLQPSPLRELFRGRLTSAERTDAAKSTTSAPVCSTSVASASTLGCGSGEASSGASQA